MRRCAMCGMLVAIWMGMYGATWAHLPEDLTFFAVQLPDTYIPILDGDVSEWDIVPDAYAIENDDMSRSMIEALIGADADLSDLAIRCIIGWNDSTNRLYFMIEVFDDVHQADRSDPEALWTDDSWEIILDADHSGGQFAGFSGLSEEETKRRTGAQATRYRLAEPPVQGVYVTTGNASTWTSEPGDWFEIGWDFVGEEFGESTYYYEFFIHPFDDLNWEGWDQSRRHDLREGEIVGIELGFRDFDDASGQPETYWNLTGVDSIYVYADRLADVFLAPMDPNLRGWFGRPKDSKSRLRLVLRNQGFLGSREIRADTYIVPGEPEDVPNLTFTLVERYSEEMQFGFFDLGRVSVSPGDPGFAREALSHAIVVFGLHDKPGEVFRWEAFAQSEWGLFIIPSGTVNDFLAAETSDFTPLFSIPAANPEGRDQMWIFNDLIEGVTIFAFEDVPLAWGVSDEDFNDLIVAVHPPMLGTPAAVTPEAPDEMPGSFSLSPNYPNPFNAETTIRYALRDPGRVQVVVYDALGRRVRTLVDEERVAGQYSVLWDGRDDEGEVMSAGVYFYRLGTDASSEASEVMGEQQVRRMVFLK